MAAFLAGHIPKNNPTIAEKVIEPIIALIGIAKGHSLNEAKRYNKCRKLYANRSACNNDNVTFGGCVWCDIVDQPPFCTEIYIAKTWPHPPQFPPWRCDKNITNGLQNES